MSLSIIVVFSHIIRVLSSSSVITSTASPEGGVMIPCANLPALTSVPPQPGSVHDEIILFFSSYCLSFRVGLIRRFLLLLKKKKKNSFMILYCLNVAAEVQLVICWGLRIKWSWFPSPLSSLGCQLVPFLLKPLAWLIYIQGVLLLLCTWWWH